MVKAEKIVYCKALCMHNIDSQCFADRIRLDEFGQCRDFKAGSVKNVPRK